MVTITVTDPKTDTVVAYKLNAGLNATLDKLESEFPTLELLEDGAGIY